VSNDNLSSQDVNPSIESSGDEALLESGNKRVKLIIVGSLLFVVIGSFVFPAWWWGFLFESGFSTSRYWYRGIGSICQTFLIPFLAVCTFLYLEPIALKKRMIGSLLKKRFNELCDFIFEKDRYIILFLIAILVISLITLNARSLSYRRDYERRTMIQRDTIETPLEQPSRFIFLSTKVIDSLFKQLEDSLAVAKVTEEFQASRNLKGEIEFSDVVKTGAEKNEAQKRITEYQANKKTPEQQIKDLVGYLHKTNSLPSYGLSPYPRASTVTDYIAGDGTGRIPKKSENEEIDDAIQLLERHDLFVDQEKLKRLRSRLLAEEIQTLESGLRTIQGQILVDGNWSIQLKNDFYIFRKSFVEKVSDSPICEFKLPKSAIIAESKSVVDDALSSSKGANIKIGIFGSVTSSVPGSLGKVTLDPIAVYLP
jgi:hypothetical protein